MSDNARSKRSRKNRGPKRKNRSKGNNKNAKGSLEDVSSPGENLDNECNDEETIDNSLDEMSTQKEDVIQIAEPDAVAKSANEPTEKLDLKNISSFEALTEIKKSHIENYTVESPKHTLKTQNKKFQYAPKSKSLDNDDDPTLNITELDVKSDEDKSLVESNAIITEADSDVEWETANNLTNDQNLIIPPKTDVLEIKPPEIDKISPQKEIDLRNFLNSLNLNSAPVEPKPEPKIKSGEPPKDTVVDVKLRKAQMKAALEEYCRSQMTRPRFLDIIDEEGSNDSSDNTRRESLNERVDSFKFIDDLDDDVFMPLNKLKEPIEYFPRPKDYRACKKELKRQQECLLVGAKIVEAEVEEGCGDWTIEKTEQKRGAEIVYLDDSSSSTSENNDFADDVDAADERVNIKTPVIELNSNFTNVYRVDKKDDAAPEGSFAANEELIESLENLLVNPPVAVACNEVIMLANEFVDEPPAIAEVLKEAKSDSLSHTNLIDSFSSSASGEESKDYSRQDSSSSVCSSHSTTHSTAKYNPLSSSLTDIDALVHDDLASAPDVNKREAACPERQTLPNPNVCETVTGRGGSSKIPSTLKELCVDKIATSEYGNSILKELASVSQSLGEFASEALSREMSAPEVPEKPKFSKLPPALHLEKTPPPVAPRQSSFKMLQEEPPWVGLQSQRDPSVVAYLSPLQRKQIEQTKNFARDEAGELIDMHCKYAGRRGYNEAVDSEKAPPSSNNNDDKIALQVARPPGEERPAPDTANRLLAIIRDPAVNPNLRQENADRPPESSFDFMETLRTFEDMNRDLSNDTRFRSWSKKGDGVKESMHIVEQHSSNKAYEAAFKNGIHHQSNLAPTACDLNAKNEKQTNSDTSKTSAIYENVEPQISTKPNREHQVPITMEKNDIFNAKSNSNAKEHEVPVTIERQSLLNSTSNQSTSSRIIESNKFTSNRGFETSVKNENLNIFDLTSKTTNGNVDSLKSPKASNQIRDVPITIEKQVLSKNNAESSNASAANQIRDVPITIERQFSELTSKNNIESSKSSAVTQIRDVPVTIERQFSELTSKNNIESSKSSAVTQIRDMPITIERQFSELTSKNSIDSSKSSAANQIRDVPVTIERQFSELASKNNIESSKSSAVTQIRDMPITIEGQFSELALKNNIESSKSSAVTQIREVPITIQKQGPSELTSKNNTETQLREVPVTIEKQAASESTLKNNMEPPILKFADQIREVPITIENRPFDPSNRTYEMSAKSEKRDIFDLTLKNRSYTESKLSDIVKAPKLSSLREEADIFDMTSANYNVMPQIQVSEFNIKNDLMSMKSTTSEKVTNGNAHEERLINVEKEVVDVKPKEGVEEAKREMQHLLNKRAFILDDPIFDPINVMKENFAIKRRGSLPKDLHERQMQYILLKEKEIEEQIRQLEDEKKLSNFDSVNVSEIKVLKSNDVAKESDQSFLADKYHISRQRDVATFQSDASKESAKSNKFERSTNLISAPSEGEKFREQMYCEYMDKVAEREERKQHKVIKITNMPNANGDSSAKVAAHPHDSKSIINDIKLACNKIEEEFITKARERWDKMGFLDSESIVDDNKGQKFEEKPVVIEHKIKVLDDDGEKDVKKLPTHLREFVEFTSNGDETEPVMFSPTFKAKAPASGVWSPGAAPSSADAPPPVSKEVVNGEAAASTPKSGAPPPPPPPPPPIWTPRSKGASPVSEKKEFRPVPFESPKLSRKNVPEPPRPERSAIPPWEVRLAGSQSAPEAAGLSGLASQASPQPPPAPALPRAQNPTITLLQKAREGQLPRGASYLEHDRDLPNDRRISPPRVRQGEVVYSLRRGYMSEPESGSDRPRKMAEIGPKKYDGIGPTTKDGMPIILRSEVKEANQSKWYKKMYDTIHKNKYDDDYVTVRYKSRRAHPSAIHTAPRSSQYAYFNPRSGYLSEPEGGGGAGGWTSDAYDSDVPQRRHSALDRRRASGKENDVSSPYLSSNKYSTLASAKASQEVYKNQPGRIEDYVPGRSSVIDKESKQWWDEVMDIFDGWLDENSPLPPYSTLLARAIQRSQLANASLQQPPSTNKQSAASSILSKSYMARALKESGYESDSTLVLRRREGGPIDPPLSPQEQKLAYRSLQAGGEPPLQGFRKPAPDKPKDDTEIEYFPLSPTLTRIRVHKNATNERTNDILCYPITSMTNPSDLFAKYQQAVPSFINLDYPKAARYSPPAPPRRLSSKANSTLKLVSSISPNSRLLKTQRDTNVKFLQNRISNKLASNTITKENRKKEVRETKMKSTDGKRIKTTRAAISVPNASTKIKTSKTIVSKKIPTDNLKGTSSFSSPRRTMSPIDYVSPTMNRFFNDNMSGSREIIEGGAGRRTPISGILDRGTSLDRTFASEKRNLPLKSIQEFPSKLSKSTELISPTDSSKNNKENKYHKTPPGITVKKTTAIYSSARNGGKISDDKTLNVSVAMSPRGRELLRTSDKLITMNKLKSLPSSDIQCQLSNISRHSPSKDKINLSYTNLHPKKSSSKSTLKSRKSLEDVSSKVKSSNSSLNSVRSSKSSVKSSKANDPHKLCKSPKDNQFGDLKADPSLTSKTYKKSKPDVDKKQIVQANKSKSSKTPKPYDKETLQYLKSVDREIDSYVAQYENNLCVNFNEIHDQRDAIMGDSFFQHLLLRGVPPQAQVEVDPDYHSTSVLEKAKFFQNPSLETSSLFNRPVNSYLSHKKPVTDSKFRSWDRYERSRPRSPRAVSWPGRMSQSCIKKFDSLSRESKSINDVGSSVVFSKIDNRSKSEPPKIVFTQTTRPRSPVVSRLRKSVESPTKIVYQRTQSPPAKIVFSQTSRPLSPVVVHTKKKKPPEPIRLPSPSKIVLTQTSRPVTPVFSKRRLRDPEEIQYIRSRSESPVVKRKSDLSYYSDSESLRKRAASPIKQVAAKHVRKIREQSPSPSPIRSPSCRRIHSARISQCRAEDGIAGLKKKILRTQSAGDAESKKKKMITPEPSFIRSNSFINLDHMRNHLSYQEYITELKHQKAKSDRFKELNRFYSYLERIGELERATSVSDLRPRRRDEEIIDFDKWKRVRAIEKAEEELDRLYKKMKLDQQEKDLLYLPHDAESLKWSKYKDWNLRAKEKSVEDLKEHFIKLADGEVDNVRYSKRDSDYHRDAYKPLWRGSSVMNLATSITKKNQPEYVEKTERTPIKTKIEPTVTNIREKLGIGSRLWSSLSMEQVSALKNQLNNIYSKEIDQKAKETPEISEEYVITVPSTSKEKPKSGLQVRCNSFTVGDAVNEMESNKSLKADSISSIQHLPMDKDMKNSFNTYQNLSEKEKKRISMSLSHEILERMKMNRAKYSPVVLAKETRGATAAARIKGIAKSSSESQSPRTCYSLEVSEDDNKHKNDFVLVLAPNNHSSKTGEEIKSIMDGWSEGKSAEDKKCLSPLRTSSASETETASSDASNKTVIYRSVKDEVQKKVDFFEKNKQESSTGSVIYHARDDSYEDKHDSLQDLDPVQDASSPPMSLKEDTPALNKLSYSQSLSSMKDLFGESQKNSALLSPAPKVVDKATVSSDVKESKANRTNLISSAVSSMENVSRSRSLSPDPEGYWRAYLSLVKAGEVQKLKRKFEDVDNVFCYEEGVPKLRRYQSDPEIIRTILQHNWNKKNLTNVKMHERGDVDRLTHKYETSSRGRSRFRRYGLTSPILKSPLRVEDREMPHIDVISKIASLKPPKTSAIGGEYPIECPIGEVNKIRQRFEKDDTSLLGQMFTSTPDIHELRDIAPYLSGPWVAHKYPKRQDNNRSLSTSDYITEDKYAPVRKDRPRPKSTSPIRAKTHKPSSILKQQVKKVDVFADQEFDPVKHRPKYRYLPPREEAPARPAFPQQLPAHTTRPTVTFQEPELAPIPPPKGIPIGRDYRSESPRRYVEGDVNIHYRVPVRQEPRPLVPEDELARRQADHMRRVYQEERRRKYLQELQDMNSRRHTDNFTPSQKSPIALNRYDSFGTRQVARALYNFEGQGARELSFRKGDLILVRRQIDNNWYEGEHNNTVGLFPYNYVEMIQYDSTTTPSQRRPTEGRARAKFNFVAQTHLELGLRKGELVTLIRRVDENWYEGRLGDRKGIFPVSYVEVLAEPVFNRSELTPSIVTGKPVASPAAHSMVGAAGAASLGAHHYTPQLNSPALSNSPSSTAPLALPNHGITSHHARPVSATLPRATDHTPINLNNHEPLYVDTNAEAVPYRAMYKYRPQNPDELELQEGETVYVLEKCDDGWYVGSSQRTGRFGTFPGNYVEKI